MILRSIQRWLARKSANTARAYSWDLVRFMKWRKSDTWAHALQDLTSQGQNCGNAMHSAYRRWMERHYSLATSTRALATIQAAASVLFHDGLVDWKLKVRRPSPFDVSSSSRQVPAPLPADLRHLYQTLEGDRSLAGLRDRAIIALLVSPVLRLQEIARLACSDIDLEAKAIQVISTKNAEPMTLPMPEATANCVSAWIRGAQIAEGTPLFRRIVRYDRKIKSPTWKKVGDQWLTPHGLSQTAIYEMTAARGRAAGFKYRLRPRGLMVAGTKMLVDICEKKAIPIESAMAIVRSKTARAFQTYADRRSSRTAEVLKFVSDFSVPHA